MLIKCCYRGCTGLLGLQEHFKWAPQNVINGIRILIITRKSSKTTTITVLNFTSKMPTATMYMVDAENINNKDMDMDVSISVCG